MHQPREVVNGALEAWTSADLDAYMALIAEDAVFRFPGGPVGQVVRGRDAIRALVSELLTAWAEDTFEVRRQLVDGNVVVTEGVATSRQRAPLRLATGDVLAGTGRRVTHDVVEIDTVVDGRIVESVSYYDRHELLRQMGQLSHSLAGGWGAIAEVN